MSQKRLIAMILVAIAILVCSSVLLPATDKSMSTKTYNIKFFQPTLVGTTMLPAGNYRVSHEMQGTTHIMLFKQVGSSTEVKVKCNLVPLTKKASQDEQRFNENAQKQQVLVEMTFRGETFTHVFEP